MSNKTLAFLGAGVLLIGAALAVYFVLYQGEDKPPCTKTIVPESVLDPLANTAEMLEHGDTLCVYCIVECHNLDQPGSCAEEAKYWADYTVQEAEQGMDIFLLPTGSSNGSTIVETRKLPASWSGEEIYGNHHFMVFYIRTAEAQSIEGFPIEENFPYEIEYEADSQQIRLTILRPPSP